MTKCHQIEFVSAGVEFVNNPVVANADAKFRSSLQPFMGKALHPPTQIPKLGFNPRLQLRRQLQKDRVKFAGIDLRSLVHAASGFADATLAEVSLAALDAGDKIGIKLSLIFQVFGKPILKFQRLLAGQIPHLRLNRFKFAHGVIFSAVRLIVKPCESDTGGY